MKTCEQLVADMAAELAPDLASRPQHIPTNKKVVEGLYAQFGPAERAILEMGILTTLLVQADAVIAA